MKIEINKKILETTKYFIRVLKILSSAGKVYLITIILLAIIAGIIPSISTLFMQEIINTLQKHTQDLNYILIIVFVYIIIDMASGLLNTLSIYLESTLQLKTSIIFNMSIVEKVKDFDLKDLENSEIYDLIQRANSTDTNQLFYFFKSAVMALQFIINLIAFSLILTSWKWCLIPIIFFMPVINIVVSAKLGKEQFFMYRERTGKSRKMWYFKHLLTNDIAFKEIKIFNLGNYFRSRYKELNLEFHRQDKALLNKKTKYQILLLILDQIVSAGLFAYVIINTFFGAILLGQMNTYTRSISNVKSSLQGFLSQLNSMYQSVLYISQYFEFIDIKKEDVQEDQLLMLNEVPSINIVNLSYKYKNQNKYALRNINFEVEKGNLIALVGQNGSGKSTLLKIISTLYGDYEGDIYIGDYNLKQLKPESVHKKIGILFQDFVRYQLSVKENVAVGQLEKMNEVSDIIQILSRMGVGNKIDNLDVQLGCWFDGGVQLSGGEWLKIALGRALIRDAEIYLLDEPNAALDSISERKILDEFKKSCNGKIGIIISHRIASIKNIADKIIVFDNGTIVAEGTHDELLKVSPVYRNLCKNEEGID